MGRGAKRRDIQLMRGVAVLAVVLFHAFETLVPNGFLGVDVFFVISGFLICGHIMAELEQGEFSFRRFYLKRARRLLPASFTTLLVTCLLALAILTPRELFAFAKQAAAFVAFLSNFLLMRHTDYFAPLAETQPLLHTWSLSLEEQFYFVAPVLLWFTPRRFRGGLIAGGMIASAAICAVLVMGMPGIGMSFSRQASAAFYLLPARAWELLAGALVAWIMLRRPGFAVPAVVKWLALLVIAGAFAISLSERHPGPDAALVVLATMAILAGDDRWLPENVIARMVQKIGDWSYSIYLVHWPLLSFATIIYVGAPPPALLAGLAALSLALGWLQYRYVEQRYLALPVTEIRRWPRREIGAGMALAALLGLAVFATIPADTRLDRGTIGLARQCNFGGSYQLEPACQSAPDPSVILWGDSQAIQLAPALETLGVDFRQATKFSCSSIPGVVPWDEGKADFAEQCLSFNDSVLHDVLASRETGTVLLSSLWARVFESQNDLLIDGVPVEGGAAKQAPAVAARLKALIDRLHHAGKRVILIGPIPYADFDLGACTDRLINRRPIVHECALRKERAEELVAGWSGLLRSVADQTGAEFLDPIAALCGSSGNCRTRIGRHNLYRDHDHLSDYGAEYLLRRLDLPARLSAPAGSGHGRSD